MKNNGKIARIVYDKGNPQMKNTVAEHEGFYLEVWDPECESWDIVCKARCRKSIDFPEAAENDFIHWDIIKHITNLSANGYIIKYAGFVRGPKDPGGDTHDEN
jgi:hypothetical protein